MNLSCDIINSIIFLFVNRRASRAKELENALPKKNVHTGARNAERSKALAKALHNPAPRECRYECPICLTEIAMDQIVMTNCPGFCQFCRNCSLEWFGACGKNKCPVCNVPVTAILHNGQPVQLPAPHTPAPPRRPPKKLSTNTISSPTVVISPTNESPSKVVSKLLKDMSPTKVQRLPTVVRFNTCNPKFLTCLLSHAYMQ